MGRNLSPFLRQELENLDKDADSRKNAMKALKSCVKTLDSKSIPLFLASVSMTKEPGSSTGEYTISLYEVLARVHGRNIVPQIDNIMATIIRTLSSSAGSFPLHQACAKVVPAIARYGIEPSMPQEEKTRIIGSLCKPLSDSLLGSSETLASGAALCLKALVESDNWRFASNDIVNELCLKLAGALEEKPTQTSAHMGLVMALSKHNSLIVDAYARSLLRSGLQVLAAGVTEGNSQKRLSAIQMLNFLMKCVDFRSISSELATVVEVMEKCQVDSMPFVKGAAYEAMQTAKMITAQKGPTYESCFSPNSCSNFTRDYIETGNYESTSWLVSPESQTVDSFFKDDSLVESSLSTGQSYSNFDQTRRANRRLWNNDKGFVDVSLKDGLFSGSGSTCNGFGWTDGGDLLGNCKEQSENFSGFVECQAANLVARGSTPSPQRPCSQLTIDNVKIFTTPRKLIRSLQNPVDGNYGCLDKQNGRVCPNATPNHEIKRNMAMDVNGYSCSQNSKTGVGRDLENKMMLHVQNNVGCVELVPDHSESVSSSGDVLSDTTCNASCEACAMVKNEVQAVSIRSSISKAGLSLVCLSLIVFAVMVSVMLTNRDEEFLYVVPT